LDCTAGNRHIWGKDKMRDDVIFTDKEPNLRIAPDLLCEWRDLPKHFPADYFHCAIFDPPFYSGQHGPFYRDVHCDPKEKAGSWWSIFSTKYSLRVELLKAQQALAIISPRICLKWCDTDEYQIDPILTLFTEFKPIFKQSWKSKSAVGKGVTWWVKLVRRGFTP